MSFSITDIQGYVEANGDKLIGKAITGSKTAQFINLQTGVKGTDNINLLTSSVTLQDGSSCGWNAVGQTTVSKRQIVTKEIKLNENFCPKDLIGTSLQWGVKIAAGQETMPFEQMIFETKIAQVNLLNDYTDWQGNTADTGATYQRYDGFITILSGETTVDGSLSGKTLAANTLDVIANVMQVIPAEIIDRPDLVCFVGYDIYRKYIAALIAANLYHFVDNFDGSNMVTKIYGTNITLVGVPGLIGTNKGFASYKENFVIGADLMNNQEQIDFWYSKDNDEYRMKIWYNRGVQVAFPDLVVSLA